MNPEIEYLARVCANIIRAQNLPASDNVLVGAQVITLLTVGEKERADETVSHRVPSSPSVSKAVVDERPRRVVIKSGGECFCTECAQPVFKIVQDVYDPATLEDLESAYQPIGHSNRGVLAEINSQGNMVDCPLCKKDSCVPLIPPSDV